MLTGCKIIPNSGIKAPRQDANEAQSRKEEVLFATLRLICVLAWSLLNNLSPALPSQSAIPGIHIAGFSAEVQTRLRRWQFVYSYL